MAFNDIIDLYYGKIEHKRREINRLGHKIKAFNKIYDVETKLTTTEKRIEKLYNQALENLEQQNKDEK